MLFSSFGFCVHVCVWVWVCLGRSDLRSLPPIVRYVNLVWGQRRGCRWPATKTRSSSSEVYMCVWVCVCVCAIVSWACWGLCTFNSFPDHDPRTLFYASVRSVRLQRDTLRPWRTSPPLSLPLKLSVTRRTFDKVRSERFISFNFRRQRRRSDALRGWFRSVRTQRSHRFGSGTGKLAPFGAGPPKGHSSGRR